MTCTKHAYPDKASAEVTIVLLRTKRRPKYESRAYECPLCLKWHLSSRPARLDRPSKHTGTLD
jgi:hypothetical protein